MSQILKWQQLLETTEQEKHHICAEFGITLDDFYELRKKGIEYVDQCEHLPKDHETALLNGFIFNNKANFEAGKRFIENFYRVKNQYADCLFDHCIPGTKKFKESAQFTYNVCTKRLLPAPHCYRVQIFKLNDPDGKADDSFVYMTILSMMCELRGAYDFWGSSVVIFDMEHLTMKNVFKTSAQWIFAIKDIMENVHLRIQGFHFLNGTSALEKMLTVFRSVLSAKLKDRIFVHSSYEELQKVIPKESLPKDYGGYDKSIEKLQEDWLEAMYELKPFFERCRKAKSTKKYEFNEEQRKSMGIGMDGSFKKLSID